MCKDNFEQGESLGELLPKYLRAQNAIQKRRGDGKNITYSSM